MTDKELKHLRRVELLEMLAVQMEENEKLREELEKTQKALSDRQITISQAGSIADAAMHLSGVFDAAQDAAAQYLENIQKLSGEQETVCRRMEDDARQKADAIRAEADAYSREAREKADAIRAEADAYSQQAREKADAIRAEADAHSQEAPKKTDANGQETRAKKGRRRGNKRRTK